MLKRLLPACLPGLIIAILVFNACTKESGQAIVKSKFAELAAANNLSTAAAKPVTDQKVLEQIKALGYSNENVQQLGDHYLVENDIVVHEHELGKSAAWGTLNIGPDEEHYRTVNTVATNGVRTLKLFIELDDPTFGLPGYFQNGLAEAINQYNNIPGGINLRLERTLDFDQADVIYFKSTTLPEGVFAAAGFPANGNPNRFIRVNFDAFEGNTSGNFIGSIFAHELGHCIGFRHTDFMARQFSCGGAPFNEGAGPIGAVYIPGTPTGPDPNSWMLACTSLGQARPFTSNDITALKFVY